MKKHPQPAKVWAIMIIDSDVIICYYIKVLKRMKWYLTIPERKLIMKRSIFKTIASLSAAAMMLLAVGCGSTSDSSSAAGTNSTAAATGEDNSLQKVLDSGKLVLGLDPTFKPMGYTDENDNIVGFDIDVAKEVCSRLGVDLNAGTIDCIWNGLSVSDERKKVMLMSEPYMKNEMVFVVNGSSDVASQADLAGKNIAVQNGSTAQETLLASDVVANGATTTELATNVEALQQLELNMVDAAFLDSVVANYEISTSGKDYKVLPDGLDPEEYAIGFRLGDQALCDKIEEILHEMKQDGKLAEISTTWFGSDITTIE